MSKNRNPLVIIPLFTMLIAACGGIEAEHELQEAALEGVEYSPSPTFTLEPGVIEDDDADLLGGPTGEGFILDGRVVYAPTKKDGRAKLAFICTMQCETTTRYFLECATSDERTTDGEFECLRRQEIEGCNLLKVERDEKNDPVCGY